MHKICLSHGIVVTFLSCGEHAIYHFFEISSDFCVYTTNNSNHLIFDCYSENENVDVFIGTQCTKSALFGTRYRKSDWQVTLCRKQVK